MPPKPKITREMVVDAAFEVARQTGSENINARTVSKQLNCSTARYVPFRDDRSFKKGCL